MKAFKINNIKPSVLDKLYGCEIENTKDTVFYDRLSECIERKGEEIVINGSLLQEIWFPQNQIRKYDIFISHSHKDIAIADRLANKLKKCFNINCFVDGKIWGDARNLELFLLKYFDDISEGNKSKIREAVYVMLAQSLLQILRFSSYAFFFNTNNSLKNSIYTYSPWIFYELSLIDLLCEIPMSKSANLLNLMESRQVKVKFEPPQSKLAELEYSYLHSILALPIEDNDSEKTKEDLFRFLDTEYKNFVSNNKGEF